MKLKVLVIALTCVFAVTLTGGLICAAFSGQEVQDYIEQTQKTFQDSLTVSPDGITAIQVDSSGDRLTVIQTPDVQNIQVDVTIETLGLHIPAPQYQLRADVHDSTLYIDVENTRGGGLIVAGSSRGAMTLYLPASYAGDLKLDTDANYIMLDSLSGLQNLSIDMSYGTLENQNGLSAQNIRMDLSDVSATLAGVTGGIDVQLDYGTLDLTMDQVNGDISMEGDSCDVTLTVPQETSAQVDIRSEYTDLLSDFTLNTNRNDDRELMYGLLGQGDQNIRVQMEYGSFYLRQLSPPASSTVDDSSMAPAA